MILKSKMRFGEIAVKSHIVHQAHVDEALAKRQPGELIGATLVRLGHMTTSDVDYVLDAQDHLRNGGWVVEEGTAGEVEVTSRLAASIAAKCGG